LNTSTVKAGNVVTDPVIRAIPVMDPIIKGISQYAAKAAGDFATMHVNKAFGHAIGKLVYEVSVKDPLTVQRLLVD
jgi:hypothetical protein